MNKLPWACNRLEATRKNVGKISMQEHETIMEEAEGAIGLSTMTTMAVKRTRVRTVMTRRMSVRAI